MISVSAQKQCVARHAQLSDFGKVWGELGKSPAVLQPVRLVQTWSNRISGNMSTALGRCSQYTSPWRTKTRLVQDRERQSGILKLHQQKQKPQSRLVCTPP